MINIQSTFLIISDLCINISHLVLFDSNSNSCTVSRQSNMCTCTYILTVHRNVTIRITNRYDFLYYVFISFFSSFPYMFRAFMGPSSGLFQAVVFMLPFGSCSALLIVCVRQPGCGGDFGVLDGLMKARNM